MAGVAGFPLYLWLLIVLIIVLVVLWFLFFQDMNGEKGSSKGEERDAAEKEPEADLAAESKDEVSEELEFERVETPESEAAADLPEESAGILHVTDELEENEPEDAAESPEVVSAVEADEVPDEVVIEVEEDDVEDVIVFEGDMSGKPDAADEKAPLAEDRLQIIEGIGPKIETVLKDAGVKTLRELSEMSPESIRAILSEYPSLRLANPESWPEQARLAANGDHAALQELQDKLKGGRIVS